MSAGADAMGVAARLTPALIFAVAVVLAHPAVGQPAGPESAGPAGTASAEPVDLVDPDCDPEEAARTDPLLVEEPDGVCTPDEPERPADGPAPGPDPAPQPGPATGSPPEAQPNQPAAAESPAAQAPPAKIGTHLAPGARRRPVSPPDRAEPERRGRTSPREPLARRRDEAEERRPKVRDRRAGPRRTADRRHTVTRRNRRRAAAELPRNRVQHAHPPHTRFPLGLQQALPDPLPPAKRLKAGFADRLERVAKRFRVPWELILAVRHARGHHGAVPASPERLRALARRLVRLGARRHPRRAIRRLARDIPFRAELEKSLPARRRGFVRRVVALAHLNRAIGRRGLVRGLKRVRAHLAREVLESPRLVIYAGGEADIRNGVTDVRVLVLLRYLASRYREVTVTSLTTGHSFLTASGNVSKHSYGRAVDIAALNGMSILGNQETGGLTERALRKIMLLPEALQPSELISLFELGGPSFALADHADHIHVGY